MTTNESNRGNHAAASAEKTHCEFQLRRWLIGEMKEMCTAAEITTARNLGSRLARVADRLKDLRVSTAAAP